ncbi:hypothetical protein AAY473_034504 [Plecturocebus cupreus]
MPVSTVLDPTSVFWEHCKRACSYSQEMTTGRSQRRGKQPSGKQKGSSRRLEPPRGEGMRRESLRNQSRAHSSLFAHPPLHKWANGREELHLRTSPPEALPDPLGEARLSVCVPTTPEEEKELIRPLRAFLTFTFILCSTDGFRAQSPVFILHESASCARCGKTPETPNPLLPREEQLSAVGNGLEAQIPASCWMKDEDNKNVLILACTDATPPRGNQMIPLYTLRHMCHKLSIKCHSSLGVVAHACNPSTLGGQGGQITSLVPGNRVRLCLPPKKKKKCHSGPKHWLSEFFQTLFSTPHASDLFTSQAVFKKPSVSPLCPQAQRRSVCLGRVWARRLPCWAPNSQCWVVLGTEQYLPREWPFSTSIRQEGEDAGTGSSLEAGLRIVEVTAFLSVGSPLSWIWTQGVPGHREEVCQAMGAMGVVTAALEEVEPGSGWLWAALRRISLPAVNLGESKGAFNQDASAGGRAIPVTEALLSGFSAQRLVSRIVCRGLHLTCTGPIQASLLFPEHTKPAPFPQALLYTFPGTCFSGVLTLFKSSQISETGSHSATLSPMLEYSGMIIAHYSLKLWASASSPLSLLYSWDYRHKPPCLRFFLIFNKLVVNSRPQTSLPLQTPCNYSNKPQHQAEILKGMNEVLTQVVDSSRRGGGGWAASEAVSQERIGQICLSDGKCECSKGKLSCQDSEWQAVGKGLGSEGAMGVSGADPSAPNHGEQSVQRSREASCPVLREASGMGVQLERGRFGRLRQTDHLRSGVRDQFDHHGENLSLLKIQN